MSKWNIGVDIIEIDRFRSLDYSSHKRFYERVFTPKEIEYCLSFKKPAAHFAANFVGKEAVYKAMNRFFDISLHDIEILRNKNGAPLVKLHSKQEAANNRRYEMNLPIEVKVSLSHSSSYAIAFVLVSNPRIRRRKVIKEVVSQ